MTGRGIRACQTVQRYAQTGKPPFKKGKRLRQVKYDGAITKEVTDFALDIMDVDKLGLDQNDRNILLMIIEKFSGGPVGLIRWLRLWGKTPEP